MNMATSLSRRALVLGIPSTTLLLPAMGRWGMPVARAADEPSAGANVSFPAIDPALAREMVGASHARVDRVRELLKMFPRLANATYDWGFGDFETALGAASHVGNREIAKMLVDNGARPDLFTHAMLGNVDAVRATIVAMPGIERVRGPHGLTLMHHAKAGESTAVIEYLKTLPGADVPYKDLPLTDEQKRVYVGQYRFGDAPDEVFEVEIHKTGWLGLKRGDGGMRKLFCQGDHTFHPAGAPEARITFVVTDGQAISVTIDCPTRVCQAIRAGAR